MKLSKRTLTVLVFAVVVILGGLYLTNASWLAASPRGRPRVIAQRGVSQRYLSGKVDSDFCTAGLILPPSHQLIDNTLPSIAAAMAAGADVVEIDIRVTKDRQFVLFHDFDLACRTNGSGRVSAHAAFELKDLDAGYGYTPDEGASFPLRGKGVGLIPTLAEVLQRYPGQQFLIQIKDGNRRVADSLVAYLGANHLAISDDLIFFGAAAPLRRLREITPAVRTWSVQTIEPCFVGYLRTGWFGHVPRVCDDGMIIVPVEQAGVLWGWPNRFLARMRAHRTQVMLIGRVDSRAIGQFSRLDTLEELSRVPSGFDGTIWTDQIAVIGPAVRTMNSADQ